MQEISAFAILIASDGEPIRVHPQMAGVKTGFARIGNPYFDGDPDWRLKDGNTVIECQPSDSRAIPVADAYQKLRAAWEAEAAELQAEEEAWEREWAERNEQRRWDETIGHLYLIQDRLMGI